MKCLRILSLAGAAAIAAMSAAPAIAAGPSDSDLAKANANRGEWLIYGRTYDNQRFSPLTAINPGNVKNLRPVWAASLGTLDGLEATRRLRRTPRVAAVPIIAISASAQSSDRAASLDAGADAFLTKPVNADELLERIGALLRLRWTTTAATQAPP